MSHMNFSCLKFTYWFWATLLQYLCWPFVKDMNGTLDKKYVYVKKSTVFEAGEGLFATKNIPKDICIAQYVGYILDEEQNQIDWQRTKQDILNGLDSDDFNSKVMELNRYRM